MNRRAGLLLHPSSLPGPFGIGEIGPAARELLSWMDAAELRIWQVLPLNPTDDGGCPYASPSAFAREPLLLSTDDLAEDGWLRAAEKPYAPGRPGPVEWREVRHRKLPALHLAADRVRESVDLRAFEAEQPELASYALYRAIAGERFEPWNEWPGPLRHREADALANARDRLAQPVERELALQWLFLQQWSRLRAAAHGRGIELWGDVPFFVGWHCCDVWERPDLWRLDDQARPVVQSGVPPDAFSETGQLWGHPLYDEAAHRADDYAWWLARLGRTLETVDRVRIDHFRGVQAVWEVPMGAPDASGGRWVDGPGWSLMEALRRAWPDMPFLAEDLGVITDDVRALRDGFNLPGMVILQFAFSHDPSQADAHLHPYLPHSHRPEQVCFTGTHDNDTVMGWWASSGEGTRDHVRRYLACHDREMPWALVRAAWRSVCDTAVVPMQDLLGLGGEARMNVPGIPDGNWSWRMGAEALNVVLAARVAEEVRLSGRAAPARYPSDVAGSGEAP